MRTQLLAILLTSLLQANSLFAEDAKLSGRTITVTGTATTEIAPDTVLISLSIRTVRDNAAQVADVHVSDIKRTVETIDRLGVPTKDVITSDMQFGENRVYKANEWIRQGFVASSEMTVKVRDLKQYIPIWKGLAGLDGVSVGGIRFDHSKRIEILGETRTKAVAVAKTKAISLANVYEMKIGKPVSITEEPDADRSLSRFQSNSQSNRLHQGDPESTTGSGGKIQIKARFTIVFELIP